MSSTVVVCCCNAFLVSTPQVGEEGVRSTLGQCWLQQSRWGVGAAEVQRPQRWLQAGTLQHSSLLWAIHSAVGLSSEGRGQQ